MGINNYPLLNLCEFLELAKEIKKLPFGVVVDCVKNLFVLQSSFLWGYIFSSVIGGALVDKYGGKRVIAWGGALWSFATLLTPLAANHSTASLLAVRAFFGLAEGVALPSMNTLLSRYYCLLMCPELYIYTQYA